MAEMSPPPEDTALESRTCEPFQMVIELGKIAEFARATGSSNPAYFGSPGDEPLSPVTFLVTSSFWMGAQNNLLPQLGLNLMRVLHGEQSFTFHGVPPRAGTVLTCRQRVGRVFRKEGGRGGTLRFIEVITDYTDKTGNPVAESCSTIIETAKATS
jgi:hypothetical protein